MMLVFDVEQGFPYFPDYHAPCRNSNYTLPQQNLEVHQTQHFQEVQENTRHHFGHKEGRSITLIVVLDQMVDVVHPKGDIEERGRNAEAVDHVSHSVRVADLNEQQWIGKEGADYGNCDGGGRVVSCHVDDHQDRNVVDNQFQDSREVCHHVSLDSDVRFVFQFLPFCLFLQPFFFLLLQPFLFLLLQPFLFLLLQLLLLLFLLFSFLFCSLCLCFFCLCFLSLLFQCFLSLLPLLLLLFRSFFLSLLPQSLLLFCYFSNSVFLFLFLTLVLDQLLSVYRWFLLFQQCLLKDSGLICFLLWLQHFDSKGDFIQDMYIPNVVLYNLTVDLLIVVQVVESDIQSQFKLLFIFERICHCFGNIIDFLILILGKQVKLDLAVQRGHSAHIQCVGILPNLGRKGLDFLRLGQHLGDGAEERESQKYLEKAEEHLFILDEVHSEGPLERDRFNAMVVIFKLLFHH